MKASMTYAEYKGFLGPCVYLVWQNDIVVSYVGETGCAHRRIFSRRNNIFRDKAFDECVRITVEFFPTKDAARTEEKRLIHLYHPKYNFRCSECKAVWSSNS